MNNIENKTICTPKVIASLWDYAGRDEFQNVEHFRIEVYNCENCDEINCIYYTKYNDTF